MSHHPLCFRSRIVLLALPFATVGCESAGADARWAGTVDTLASGALHVRSPAEGAWSEAERWRLVEDLRIGSLEGEGPELFGAVRDVEVDGLGRLWVLESQALELRVFGPDGSHVRTVGRQGGGPGEFELPVSILPSPDGTWWISDIRNRRYEVFDTSGARVRGMPIAGTGFGFGDAFDHDGWLVTREVLRRPDQETRQVIILRNPAAHLAAVDTVAAWTLGDQVMIDADLSLPGGRTATVQMPVPLVHQPGWDLEADGYAWAWEGGGAYRLVKHDVRGDTVLVVERDYRAVPVSDSARADALEADMPMEAEASVPEDLVPFEHPPFTSLAVAPDGHLWVWRMVGEEARGFDVFDPEGRYLGEVATDLDLVGFRLLAVRDDALYGVLPGDFDEPYVVRLRVEKPTG